MITSDPLTVHRADVAADMLATVAERIVEWDGGGRDSQVITGDPWVDAVAVVVTSLLGERPTTVAFQAYRDGTAGTDWHDDRTMTGVSGILTVGATRLFQIRAYDTAETWDITADHGSFIVLPTAFHHHFQHRIAPEPDVHDPRYSFLFRTPVPKGQ